MIVDINSEDTKVLCDILLWNGCREMAEKKDIKLSASHRGYEVKKDKGYWFTNLHDLCSFLDGYSDE